MLRISKERYMVADFETTVYKGQTETEVWACGIDYIFKDEYYLFHNIESVIKYIIDLRQNLVIYFHNLKFDGTFIISYLLNNGWEYKKGKLEHFDSKKFTALISAQRRFYTITLRTPYATVEFRDSVKLMPFTLDKVGKAFETKHRKLTMEYKGKRFANCPISEEEEKYIKNDVMVLKEAMAHMLNSGFDKLTIGACCLSDFKKTLSKDELSYIFPNLKDIKLPEESIGISEGDNVEYWIRKTYKGGWSYCKEEGVFYNGRTFDVNSLYPFVMHSKSGNYYPVGEPVFFKNKIPDLCKREDIIYFVRLKCRFRLLKNHLPTVMIKNSFLYKPNKWLTTSEIEFKGKFYEIIELKGKYYTDKVELFLTCVDYELFKKHYKVMDEEIIEGFWFYGEKGIFDDYIEKWNYRKENAKNKVERTQSKLMNNNLYGKLATSDDSSSLIPYLDDEGVVCYELDESHDKKTMSIACGSMVTSYARRKTITAAQENYDIFCYSDTDSLHLNGNPSNLDVDNKKLGCWALEKEWSKGIFIRAKCYAEFLRKEDGKKVYPHWEITCAGMSDKSKKIFLSEHPITDFKKGLSVRGNLKPKNIKGGVILEDKNFTLRC